MKCIVFKFVILAFVCAIIPALCYTPANLYPNNAPGYFFTMTDPYFNVSGSISYSFQFHHAAYGPNFIGNNADKSVFSGRLLWAQDQFGTGCLASDYPTFYPGTNVRTNGTCIALAYKGGGCNNRVKTLSAQTAGCIALLSPVCDSGPPTFCTKERTLMFALPTGSTPPAFIGIPAASLTYEDGKIIFDALKTNPTSPIYAQIPGTGPVTNPAEIDGVIAMSKSMFILPAYTNDFTIGIQNYWKSPVDPCMNRVNSISCKGGSIYMIDANSLPMMGTIPSAINNFRNLEILTYGLGYISGSVPQLNMSSLLQFYIYSSKSATNPGINGIFSSVAPFPNLQILCLDGNALVSLPSDLHLLKYLRYFNVANNYLTSTPTLNAPKLQWYQVNNNLISQTVPNFSNSDLMVIMIGSNKFVSSNVTELFNYLPNLVQVDMSNNLILGSVPFFRNCSMLEGIIMSNNSFTGGLPTTWNIPKLIYVDVSNNLLTGPFTFIATSLTDFIGHHNAFSQDAFSTTAVSFVLAYLPGTMQNIDFSFNKFYGEWTVFSPNNFLLLNKLLLQNNTITSLPTDLFNWIPPYFDISNNRLNGDFPSQNPSARIQNIRVQGNPQFKAKSGNIPSWALQSKPFIVSDSFSCPSVVGNVGYSFVMSIDASYYNFQNCVCDRGYYQNPPYCLDIPKVVNVTLNNTDSSYASFSDSMYGSSRLTLGVDISWVLNSPVVGAKAFYINIQAKRQYFKSFDDVIEIYTGGSSLQGTRVLSFRGTDVDPSSNIVQSNIQPGTQVVLDKVATLNFRSRNLAGNHFVANFTVAFECPSLYKYDFSSERCFYYFNLDSGIQNAMFAVLSIFNLILIFVCAVIVKKRNSLIIRSSSFPFCFSMLIFMILLGCGSYFYVISPSAGDFICNLRPWFTACPLVGILSALLVKVDRIRRIFTSKELVVQTISNSQLARTMGLMILAEAAILIGFSASKLSEFRLKIGSGYTGGQLVAECTSFDSSAGSTAFNAWLIIQCIYIAVFLMVAVVIAWSVRKVPSAFNEAPSIASSLFSLTLILIILIPLNFMVDDNPNALMVIRGLGQVLITIVLALFFFGPKLYLILEGKENDKVLSSVGTSSSSSSSSSQHSTTNESATSQNDLLLFKALKSSLENILSGCNDVSPLSNIRKSLENSWKSGNGNQILNITEEIERMLSTHMEKDNK